MAKTISKLTAVILSVVMLIGLPTVASAADTDAPIRNVAFSVIDGEWSHDYINRMSLKFDCEANHVNGDALIVVSLGSKENVIKTVSASDASVSVSGNTISVEFALDRTVNHADVYIFTICEGAFVSRNGTLNAEYVYTTTGNKMVESIDTVEIAVTPIQRLIEWMESLNKSWLKPVIQILIWFTQL